jgi:hypothetical protein
MGFPGNMSPEAHTAGCTTPKSEVIIGVPPARSYNASRAGLVDGAGYPACSWGVSFGVREFWRDVPQNKIMM